MAPTVHASAILVGARALLIRGPAGAGKSELVMALLHEADRGTLAFARLVADDRAQLEAAHGRLLVRPAPELAGLIEVRGLGIRRLPYEPVAAVGTVVDLGLPRVDRLPQPAEREIAIAGVPLPRLAVAASTPPLPMVLAYLLTERAV
jgi:HPr kinase/phosphorylase